MYLLSKITHMDSREAACSALGGVMQSETCIVQSERSTLTADCMRACATQVYADELGSCYEWQRTVDGGTRAVYRMTGTCWSKYARFDALCEPSPEGAKCGGVCAGAGNAAERRELRP